LEVITVKILRVLLSGPVLILLSLVPAAAQAQMPNPYGPSIGVESARKVAAVAVAEARKNSWTMAVAVVGVDGELIFFERMDNTQSGSTRVAQEKARTAAQFKRPTKALEDAVVGGRTVVVALPGATPIEGGIPLLVDGKIVGAVGVSGGMSSQDGICAQAAADSLGGKPTAAPAAAPVKK
jgi:glc operon protein GlcG